MANRRTTIEIPESKLHKQEQEKKRVEMFQTLNQSLASANKAVKHYLSIKVDGLWPNENTTDMGLRYCACHQYGEWKIIVPAALMNFDEEVIKGKEPYQLQGIYQSYINEMVDATIDVVVIAIDTASKRVLASRKMAMDYLEERNYFKEDKGGLSKIERAVRDNKNIESRVITVREKWVLLDVLGHQVKMLVNDVGWRFVPDARAIVYAGDVVPVKVKELNIDKENKKIEMQVSMKEALPNQNVANSKKYPAGSTCTGTVVAISNGAYFVQTGDFVNGVDILCKIINSPELPEERDKVLVKIGYVNEEQGRIFGTIERITSKHNRMLNL